MIIDWKEIKKQSIDQPAHAAWGAASGAVPIFVNWIVPGSFLVSMCIVTSCGSCWFWTRRERLQFRDGSHRTWDPALDNAVFYLSVCIGILLPFNLLP